jgi:uncharacterized protein involved in exopolysaccharide biosynthesis
MSRNGCRVVYSEERVRALFARMRHELHELADRHAAEVNAMRAELNEVRAQFDQLRSISLARQRAEVELAELRRLREIGRARAAERDPAQPLQ